MASERPDKKEKKDKSKKRSEKDGVTKSSSKKDKKEKKEKSAKKLEKKLEAADLADVAGEKKEKKKVKKEEEDSEDEDDVEEDAEEDENKAKKMKVDMEGLEMILVPFAKPLIDEEKQLKKVLKTVRKSAQSKTLKRGVKEVVKFLRKSPSHTSDSTSSSGIKFQGVVVIAADIHPMDVISHIPVLCEDHGVPYSFVRSRADLGDAGATKRATSVVMVCEKKVSGRGKAGDKGEKGKDVKGEKEGPVEGFEEAYRELVKIVQKETLKQVTL